MARPLDEQGQALLDAASELLAKDGIGAVTVRRIASEAGCSTMGVYSRFGGKDGVLEELYKEGVRRLLASMEAVGETDDPLDDLRRCVRAYRRNALDNATHYLIVFGGAAPGFVPSVEARTESLAAFGRLVWRVRRVQDAGLIVDEPAEALAEVIWGTIHGHVMLEIIHMSATLGDPEHRYERTIDLLFQGMACPPDAVRAERATGPVDDGPGGDHSGAGGI